MSCAHRGYDLSLVTKKERQYLLKSKNAKLVYPEEANDYELQSTNIVNIDSIAQKRSPASYEINEELKSTRYIRATISEQKSILIDE